MRLTHGERWAPTRAARADEARGAPGDDGEEPLNADGVDNGERVGDEERFECKLQ